MNFVNPLEVKVVTVETEVFIKSRSTGLVLELLPPSDPKVKAVEAKHRQEAMRTKADGVDLLEYTVSKLDARIDDRIVAHVAGWHWREGAALAHIQYSEEQLREFLAARPFGDYIREQVLRKVEREENFIEMPADD